jgi:hypothetical protein
MLTCKQIPESRLDMSYAYMKGWNPMIRHTFLSYSNPILFTIVSKHIRRILSNLQLKIDELVYNPSYGPLPVVSIYRIYNPIFNQL